MYTKKDENEDVYYISSNTFLPSGDTRAPLHEVTHNKRVPSEEFTVLNVIELSRSSLTDYRPPPPSAITSYETCNSLE